MPASTTAAPRVADDMASPPPPRGGGADARDPARLVVRGAIPGAGVTILLVHAWGMGGTIRTMLKVAGRLAERHEVEVASVWRTCERPVLRVPAGRHRPRGRGPPARGRRPASRAPSAAFPARSVYPGDRRAGGRRCGPTSGSVRALWRVRSGVLIGTRPALNLLVAQAGSRPGAGGDRACSVQRATTRCSSARSGAATRRSTGIVVLGEDERATFERVTGGATPVHVIPNAAPALPGGRSRAGRSRRRRGRAAAPGQGLRPADPRLRRGGGGASGLAAADLRPRPERKGAASAGRGARARGARRASSAASARSRPSSRRRRSSCSARAPRAAAGAARGDEQGAGGRELRVSDRASWR